MLPSVDELKRMVLIRNLLLMQIQAHKRTTPVSTPYNTKVQKTDAQIVGRASTKPEGTVCHWYLVEPKTGKYYWYTLEYVTNHFENALKTFNGAKGDDPKGNGFVERVVDARGTLASRQYYVQWTVSEGVPER
jgi:hypothetical protein